MRVVSVMAHPDDAEFLCAGTLRLLVEKGWELRCITLSGGDMGAPAGDRATVRDVRIEEAKRAAEIIGGSYRWAGLSDLGIYYCPEQLQKVSDALREYGPDVVITHSPDCYMIDHEETSRLVRTACFAAAIPLFPGRVAPSRSGVPALYYADPFEGKDHFGRPVNTSFRVDVSSTFEVRQKALACHASQREWLRSQNGMDDYLSTNETFARQQGALCGVTFAEGFRQHLGHGYPQQNLLGEALSEFTIEERDPNGR